MSPAEECALRADPTHEVETEDVLRWLVYAVVLAAVAGVWILWVGW